MARSDVRSLAVLTFVVVGALLWTAFMPRRSGSVRDPALPLPRIELVNGRLLISAPPGLGVHYSLDGSEPGADALEFPGEMPLPSSARRITRLISTPSSVQWRHPLGSFPAATVVRACVIDDQGDPGPVATRSFAPSTNGLMVISIVLPEGALFDPDTGIYVTGHGIFHDEEESVRRYPDDQRWWKYPGNYQFRGGQWERSAHLEVMADGEATWGGEVRLRIHGNNTRGFPQHALRVIFDQPVTALDGRRHGSVILRAAGNDQGRAFMRDALQHRLCAGLPFVTSATRHALVYINGAYFGIHEVRERIDEEELALRHALKKKDISILADDALLYRGDPTSIKDFYKLLWFAENLDPGSTAFRDSINRRLDVDGFLTYMAAQFILGNMDWPDQNVKYWRCDPARGMPGRRNMVQDGRWRFIMGDSDLGFGLNPGPDPGMAGADLDLFAHVEQKHSPVARLFNALMRDGGSRDQFRHRLLELLDGSLSDHAMVGAVEELAAELAPVMPDHIRRWRRPLDMDAWTRNVADLQTFARERGEVVRRQMDQHLPALP